MTNQPSLDFSSNNQTDDDCSDSQTISAVSTKAGQSEFESRTLKFIERLDGAYSEHTIRAYRYNL